MFGEKRLRNENQSMHIQSIVELALKHHFKIWGQKRHFVNNSFVLAVYPAMKCYFASMKKTTPAAVCCALIAIGVIGSAPRTHADEAAERLLQGVRHGATLQNNRLEGHLRKNGKRTPLTLTMKGKNISFQFFTQNKWGGFLMQLNEGRAKLFETVQGKAKPFPAAKIGQAILNSDVTYEDLSLRFLYWKEAQIVGQEKIKMQNCHKIRLRNPGKDGRYSLVYIWVHEKFGALMQVAGYNSKGQLIKRFHVTELMHVGNVQTLKKMNVETYQTGTNKVIGVTYLEFNEPKRKRL